MFHALAKYNDLLEVTSISGIGIGALFTATDMAAKLIIAGLTIYFLHLRIKNEKKKG